MKKRILSILLAVALLLSVGVVPARAADSCVSVKADAATTAEVVAGDLLEIPLGDIFRDSDGHSLTYTLVNAAQFGTQTKAGGSTLYVSEKDPGTYEPKIKATCSGGKSVTATLTVTVKPAPHGLDAQYNYDESPAKEVTVYVTISNDGVPIRGRDGTILCHKAITVPYFDLSQYGLDEFYRYHTANGEGEYVDNNIVERPTGLHLYIYLLERYFIGLPESQCCKGRYDRGGLEGFRLDDDVYYMDEDPAYTASLAALKITGSPTSLYMANFWGHDENLMSGYKVRNGITIYLRFTLSYGKDIGGYDATGGGYGALSSYCGLWINGGYQALDHDFEEVERVEPTETEDGYILYRCTRCHEEETDVLPATGGETEPTDPDPTDPDPTDPTPTDPTEPTPTDPTGPEPTEPTPTDPSEPTPTEPTPTEPSEPEPTDPGEPDPAEQASIQAMGRETRGYWGDKLVYCQRLIKRILEAAA